MRPPHPFPSVEEAYRKLVGPPAGSDPVAAAKSRIEAEQRQRQTEAEYCKPLGVPEGAALANSAPGMAPPPEKFDATAEALKRIEATNRACEVEAEVLRLTETDLDKFARTLQAGAKLLGGFTAGLHAVNSYVQSSIEAERRRAGEQECLRQTTTAWAASTTPRTSRASGSRSSPRWPRPSGHN